jgi:hypothetical protein
MNPTSIKTDTSHPAIRYMINNKSFRKNSTEIVRLCLEKFGNMEVALRHVNIYISFVGDWFKKEWDKCELKDRLKMKMLLEMRTARWFFEALRRCSRSVRLN